MTKYNVFWTMTVNHCGEEIEIKNFDIFDCDFDKETTDINDYFDNLLEEYLLGDLDKNVNFSITAQTDYYQNIFDFKITKILELEEENSEE